MNDLIQLGKQRRDSDTSSIVTSLSGLSGADQFDRAAATAASESSRHGEGGSRPRGSPGNGKKKDVLGTSLIHVNFPTHPLTLGLEEYDHHIQKLLSKKSVELFPPPINGKDMRSRQ